MNQGNRFNPHTMLETYRANANDFMREQAAAFKAMAPSDQREFLFYMMANMAISQAALVDLVSLPDAPSTETKAGMQ